MMCGMALLSNPMRRYSAMRLATSSAGTPGFAASVARFMVVAPILIPQLEGHVLRLQVRVQPLVAQFAPQAAFLPATERPLPHGRHRIVDANDSPLQPRGH